MLLRSRSLLVVILLLGIYLDEISGESKRIRGRHRKRGVIRKTRKSIFQNLNQPKSGRAFQVLNQPKGAQAIAQPIPPITAPRKYFYLL